MARPLQECYPSAWTKLLPINPDCTLFPPNNSMEPPPLRFAKHPEEGRGSSTDPGQPEVTFGAILALAGRAAHLEAVRRADRRNPSGTDPTSCSLPKECPCGSPTQSHPPKNGGVQGRSSHGRRSESVPTGEARILRKEEFLLRMSRWSLAAVAGWIAGAFLERQPPHRRRRPQTPP